MKSLWSLLWRQSSDAIQTRIEALPNFDTMQDISTGLELLQTIQRLMFNVQEQKYKVLSVHLAKCQFYLFKQEKNFTVADYFEQYNNLLKVLEACGANLGDDDRITQKLLESQGINPNAATAAEKELAEKLGKEWYFALTFLMGSDRTRFGHPSGEPGE